MAEDNKTDEENDPDAIDDAPAELNEDELDEDDDEDDDDDDAAQDTPRTKRKKADEEDDDDELLDDDVEEDLDKILKDRLVAADDEEEEEDNSKPVSGAGGEQLQPKQRDEQLCSTCFLLVRSNAPNCPIGDDDCPIFS